MSYCLNPHCQKPQQNPSDAKFCLSCGEKIILGGRYRAIELLGAGGFGRTFLATDEQNSHRPRCVIKQFFPQAQGFVNTVKAAELFRQEAFRLEILGKHPQIPQLLAHFEQEKQQYLVQEFVEGRNLAQELAETGSFNEIKIRKLLKDLLPVLQFVHSNQLIHRDIKPENIIRRRQDKQLVLVDFGAAKLVDKSSLQKTDTIIGTAAYTAPEQLRGKATFASDIYSLGVTCVHLLTQMSPFDLFDNRDGNWAWRDYTRQIISDQIGQVLDKMLEPALNRRYLSTAQVIKALNPSLSQPATPAQNLAFPLQKQRLEIYQALQSVLGSHQLKVQVNLAKNCLTIVLNRPENNPVNYDLLAGEIKQKLNALKLGSNEVKIFGRINNNPVSEWQCVWKINSPSQPKKPPHSSQNQPTSTKKTKFGKKQNELVMDGFIFLAVISIFLHRVIILEPINSLNIAFFLVAIKHILSRQQEIKTEAIFLQLLVVSFVVNILDLRLEIRNQIIGVFLTIFLVSLPALYLKKTVKHS
ncbi:serine/threonine protein kinase [Ancylothrix sp. C2]|uniref:serine/threonine-protein kinase n=1 Tax=Ancylothrix sp. D3o TaxID=2953691 RepID=UPI0021BA6F03|nr:serine/threonine-protein kinase [Ancylothrix sp. D3o]MCT7951867.1 serine/threonine protein kinase [Ancylothrix sp. D3o]